MNIRSEMKLRRGRGWVRHAASAVSAFMLAAGLVACGGGGDDGVTSREQAQETVTAALSGAIFTTDSACTGTDLNIYNDKADVFLDGGPRKVGSAGLPEGDYWVQVTTPDGTQLGQTTSASVHINADGSFAACYRLSEILSTTSSGLTAAGYDDTTNAGGEYKAWISTDATFTNSSTKTDNFKVRQRGDCPEGQVKDQFGNCVEITPDGKLEVKKFYDANANGVKDPTEVYIDGWKVAIPAVSTDPYYTPVLNLIVAPGDYSVSEFMPVETNWAATTASPVTATVLSGATTTVEFGNLCKGAGGGLTLGFWSNTNGKALFGADDLALMVSLNLRNASGGAFDPASYSAFRTWILAATATNMANMLSAQLAAMELNVLNGKVSGGALIYVGTSWKGTAIAITGLNALGYASVNDVMTAANASLGANGNTTAAGPIRNYQEALKNALDAANNNKNFVQAAPCAFTFP